MSTDIELLPSSVAAFTEALKGERGSLDAWLEVNDEREVAAHVEAYARANVVHAAAAKDAEIETLRAEVGTATRMHAITRGHLEAAEARAERLAEAGRRVTAAFRAHGEASSFTRQAERTRHECEAAMLSLADALRDHDQEVGNG